MTLPSVLVAPGSDGIAAVDASHAFVSNSGTGQLIGVSVGATPVDVTDGPTGTAGVRLLGFTTPEIGFAIAIPTSGPDELWRTTDGGLTWSVVPV